MSLAPRLRYLVIGMVTAMGLLVPGAVAQRLVNATEGSGIANEATRYEGARRFTDCSHLVHRIFASLGLEYDYATSNQLYSGIDEFERVKRPQSGDLIVWRGHVGVVVDPEERTFFSAVTSGMRTHDYGSSYWSSRGKPRFYRFVLSGAAPPQLIAAASGKGARPRVASAKKPQVRSAGARHRIISTALRIGRSHSRTSRAAAAAAILIRR